MYPYPVAVIKITLEINKRDRRDPSCFVQAQYDYVNIPYDMVESIELVQMPDPGEIIEGRDDMSIRYGTWTNEVWGEYTVCADLSASNAIAVYLNDGRIFVFSRKSDAETQSIYDTFQIHLNP